MGRSGYSLGVKMATTYTTLLGYALPTTGELDGLWGAEVNDSITQLEIGRAHV